jgi:hypothetical protein
VSDTAENDAGCHPGCALGGADHPGSRGYRCIDGHGVTLPFPGEDYPYQDEPCRVCLNPACRGGCL